MRVFLDASFSGASHTGSLLRNASPVFFNAELPQVSLGKVTVLVAAQGHQVASWDRQAKHGLFTHHLMDALYGKGDHDVDGRVTAREAKAYLDRHMTPAAKRLWKRRQEASLVGNADAVLSAAGAEGVFPPRPMLGGGELEAAAGGERRRVRAGLPRLAVARITPGCCQSIP